MTGLFSSFGWPTKCVVPGPNPLTAGKAEGTSEMRGQQRTTETGVLIS